MLDMAFSLQFWSANDVLLLTVLYVCRCDGVPVSEVGRVSRHRLLLLADVAEVVAVIVRPRSVAGGPK